MKLLHSNGRVTASATDEYEGPDDFVVVPDDFDISRIDHYVIVDGRAIEKQVVPEEVTMGQCRLALYDIHGIKSNEEFLALAEMVPEEQRERAVIELSTRTSVRRDSLLVQFICAVKGWDADELFVHAALQ